MPGVSRPLHYDRRPHAPSPPTQEVHGPLPVTSSSSSPDGPVQAVEADLPIAVQKEPRSCTLHPVSYRGMSAQFHAFLTNLDDIVIPKSVAEAI
jgi:hypothetical protein